MYCQGEENLRFICHVFGMISPSANFPSYSSVSKIQLPGFIEPSKVRSRCRGMCVKGGEVTYIDFIIKLFCSIIPLVGYLSLLSSPILF